MAIIGKNDVAFDYEKGFGSHDGLCADPVVPVALSVMPDRLITHDTTPVLLPIPHQEIDRIVLYMVSGEIETQLLAREFIA